MGSANWITGTPSDIAENERLLATSLLSRSDLLTFFSMPAASGVLGLTQVTAGAGAGTTNVSGALSLNGGTSGAGVERLLGFSDGSTFSRFIRAGQDWFISGRWRAATAPATGTQMYNGGMDSSSNKLQVGVVFATNGTNFCLTGPTGTAMASALAFDTSFHTFRAWRKGTVTSLQIDSGAVVTGNVDTLTDLSPVAEVVTGTAAAQSQELVWFQASAPMR